MTGMEGDHIWDRPPVHADGRPYTAAELAEWEEEKRTLREFLDRYHATPPERRRPMGDKFSGPMTLPGGGVSRADEDEPED